MHVACRNLERGPGQVKRHHPVWQAWTDPQALIKWFGHQAELWEEFVQRYYAELDEHRAALEPIRAALQHSDVTLLYSAHDTEHNNAVALRAYLQGEHSGDAAP